MQMQSQLTPISRIVGIVFLVLAGAATAHAQGAWTPADLGTLGGSFSRAEDNNEAGDVVGQAETAGGDLHAFLWTAAGGMVDLGTLGGTRSEAVGINNAGQVVGHSALPGDQDTRAFLKTRGRSCGRPAAAW